MKKVVWGVISTASIGMEKVLPAMQQSAWCDIRAIASRSLESARKAADKLGIERAYGSYEELLADPEIEAVYNPLPNHLHVPMTLAAARAGKHVLCEKPIAIDARQAAELREVAGKVHVMEAFMVRFHPQWLRARDTLLPLAKQKADLETAAYGAGAAGLPDVLTAFAGMADAQLTALDREAAVAIDAARLTLTYGSDAQ